MAYVKQTWENLPKQTTPISAERLTHMEDGIYDAYSVSEEITLAANLWVEASDGGYEYTVQDATVTDKDLVIITMSRDNQKKFKDGDVKSSNGSFKITTSTAPTEDVVVNVTIVKTGNKGDES